MSQRSDIISDVVQEVRDFFDSVHEDDWPEYLIYLKELVAELEGKDK